MIFSGPPGPKFIAEALVVSENVGEGGPGDFVLLPDIVRERNERAEGIVFVNVEGGDGSEGALGGAERAKGGGERI